MDKIQRAHAVVSEKLIEIRDECFIPEMKLTLIARHPDLPDGYMVVTDDELGAIADTVDFARLRERKVKP
jgi:hypothetical protein